MTAVQVSIRSLPFIILWPLVFTSVFAQESGTRADRLGANNRVTASEADPAANFHLTGVVISHSGRLALVNGRVSREGDRVAGAEILAIREGEVQILMGSREFTVRVGATAVSLQPSGSTIDMSRESTKMRFTQEQNPPVVTTLFPDSTLAQFNSDARHGPVKQGETLSEIAQHYLIGGVTMNQMMIALFEANQQAFGENINILYKGTILEIPDEDALHYQSPEIATAAVARHMDTWRTGHQQQIRLSKLIDSRRYGPVTGGETLSDIAVRVSRNGATLNQMMMALFEANPQAFGGNINILHEGAILKVPDEDELNHQAPATANAEVLRQMDAWRPDSLQQLRSTSAHARITALGRESFRPTGDILYWMKSDE